MKHLVNGPLQLVSHVVQKHLAGEQETHWDKTNKELTSSQMVIVCLSCPSAFLAHQHDVFVTDVLQRAYYQHEDDKGKLTAVTNFEQLMFRALALRRRRISTKISLLQRRANARNVSF